jgi:hypothetical protein
VEDPWRIEDAEGEMRELPRRFETVGVLVGEDYHARSAEL